MPPSPLFRRRVIRCGAGTLSALLLTSLCGCSDTIKSNSNSRFAYVTNTDDNTVSRYALNNLTGDLTLLGVTPVGHSPRSVMTFTNLQTNLHYAYVANAADKTVSQFLIQRDGSLTPLSPPTVAAGLNPSVLAPGAAEKGEIDVLNQGDNTAMRFIANADGTLKLFETGHTGAVPYNVVTVQGKKEVVNAGDSTLSLFDDHFNQLAPATLPTGVLPVDIFSQDSRLYVANKDSSTLSRFSLSTDGIPQPAEATISAPGKPISITGDGYARIYVATQSGTILQYSVAKAFGSAGIVFYTPAPVTPLDPPAVSFAAQPAVIRFFDGSVYLVANTAHKIIHYNVNQDGTLGATSNIAPATGSNPTSIALIDTSGSDTLKTTVK